MGKVAMTDGDNGALVIRLDGAIVATIDRAGAISLGKVTATTPAELQSVAQALASAANVARQRAQQDQRIEREQAIAQLKEQVDPALLEQAGIA